MSLKTYSLFASCPRGLELLLLEELRAFGIEELKETVGGVYFSTPIKGLYFSCLWSRLASRITLSLLEFQADEIDVISDALSDFAWEGHIKEDSSILVNFTGSNHLIKNTQFGAQKVKDGIVDRMRVKTGQRPSVDKANPDIRIQAHLAKGICRVSLDLCGGSLQNRTYSEINERNSLHANLASALLIRSQWPALSQKSAPFYDFQCNKGTLLMEAALMAANIAPGLYHGAYGFENWLQHEAVLWETTLNDAEQKREEGLNRKVEIVGFDSKNSRVHTCKDKIRNAGLSALIQIKQEKIVDISSVHQGMVNGLVLSALPFDEEEEGNGVLNQLYQDFGEKLKQEFTGWHAGVLTSNPALARQLNIRAKKKYKFQNQQDQAQLMLFDIIEDNFYTRDAESTKHAPAPKPLSEGALMFSNRLKKNQKQLNKWLKQNQISCYRLYDADMPEYAVAVDIFQSTIGETYAHVQEYVAPKTIDPEKVALRFSEIKSALPSALGINENNITYKERRQQKGKAQYERRNESKQTEFIEVQEGQAKFWINLHDYLDVGLFLDHRPLRLEIAAMAQNQRFLNLFCYTASPTVHAALAGAQSSVSVDMSNTYIDWGKRNLQLNNIDTNKHQLIQADCFQWLKNARDKFDLIMLDPPSFSNSKRMDSVLDIQRDHVGLIKLTMNLLENDGTLIFSNNLRSFKLDADLLSDFDITDISAQTLDRDFQRNKKIHQCWLISRH